MHQAIQCANRTNQYEAKCSTCQLVHARSLVGLFDLSERAVGTASILCSESLNALNGTGGSSWEETINGYAFNSSLLLCDECAKAYYNSHGPSSSSTNSRFLQIYLPLCGQSDRQGSREGLSLNHIILAADM
jgi:hypothetical protein